MFTAFLANDGLQGPGGPSSAPLLQSVPAGTLPCLRLYTLTLTLTSTPYTWRALKVWIQTPDPGMSLDWQAAGQAHGRWRGQGCGSSALLSTGCRPGTYPVTVRAPASDRSVIGIWDAPGRTVREMTPVLQARSFSYGRRLAGLAEGAGGLGLWSAGRPLGAASIRNSCTLVFSPPCDGLVSCFRIFNWA